jgi:hypothetical protein
MILAPLSNVPLVSVVITAYNYAPFVPAAINSVLGQTYSRLEILVADDGSTDETTQIVQRYQAQDGRVRLLRGDNVGQPANTNRGVAAASGELICFLDADDEFRSGKIAATVATLQRFPDCGVCLHPLQTVTRTGKPYAPAWPTRIDSGWVAERLLSQGGFGSFPPTSAITLRREVAEQVFPLRTTSRRGGDRYILFPAALLTKVCVQSHPYALYRYHGKNMTFRTPFRAQLSELEEIYDTRRRFVLERYGEEAAARLRLIDAPVYVYCALAYLLTTGGSEYQGLSVADLINCLPAGRRKRKWTFLFHLPHQLAKKAFWTRRYLANILSYLRPAEHG